MAKQIEVKLVRSVICSPRWMRRIVQSLGLGKLQSTKVHQDNPAIRGMVAKVPHLVAVKELEG